MSSEKDIMPLNADLLTQILRRVDSITLANAECVSSHFYSIVSHEGMWEEKCCSLWPSIADTDIRELISSSLGGFRKFYASCYPFVVCDDSSHRDSASNELQKLPDDRLVLNSGVPSDFLWVVDVQYKNKAIFSKVVWGIPFADKFPGWFIESPFRIDIISLDDEDTGEDGLPTIMSVKEVGKVGECWLQLIDDIKLSWIVINRRTGKAANLSSWSPLAGLRYSVSDADFLMRFGSILPADTILPFKFVHCILAMKCRFSDSDHKSVQIIELSMRLEDMMGDDVNGKDSLLILESALRCRRSKNRSQILEFHKNYMTEQIKFRNGTIRSEGCPYTLSIIPGVVAYVSFCYFIFRESRITLRM